MVRRPQQRVDLPHSLVQRSSETDSRPQPPSPAPRFVTYLRVSTDKQGRSGLGLEAQRAAVVRHAAAAGGSIIGEHVEVQSGRNKDRPQLAAALADCRARRAVLVAAKLDCLARNVHFVAGLMESGVEFIASDMPTVNRLTIHILAAVAEEEARRRTKAVLPLPGAGARGRRHYPVAVR